MKSVIWDYARNSVWAPSQFRLLGGEPLVIGAFLDTFEERCAEVAFAGIGQHRKNDGSLLRTRRNFEMHLALQPHLVAWFHALAAVMPGRASFSGI